MTTKVLVTFSISEISSLDFCRGAASRQDFIRSLVRRLPDATVYVAPLVAPEEVGVAQTVAVPVPSRGPQKPVKGTVQRDCPHPHGAKQGLDCRLCGAKDVHS